jgi:transposase
MLSELLNLSELSIEKAVLKETNIRIFAVSHQQTRQCKHCGCDCDKVNQKTYREIKDLPISGRSVQITLTVRVFKCLKCAKTFAETFDFVRPGQRMTIRYEENVYKRFKSTDLTAIMLQENLSWKTLQNILRHYFYKTVDMKSKFDSVKNIGIDEIALHKGHRDFVIVLVDLDTGDLLDIVKGRTKAVLKAYFEAKGVDFCAKIENFAADFWEGYHNVAKEMLPNATRIGDRFHFMSKVQDAVDATRKAMRKAEETKKSPLLVHSKYIFLKNPKKLKPAQKEQLALIRAEPLFAELVAIYDLKNDFHNLFNRRISGKQAEDAFDEWIDKAKALNNEIITKMLTFFTTWRTTVLNYFQNRYSTGRVEGTNNKLKMIKRKAFGFNNFENFRIKCLFECNYKPFTS